MRVMIYDKTDLTKGPEESTLGRRALTLTWLLGGRLYRWFHWLQKSKGFDNWSDAFDWLLKVGSKKKIKRVSFWGHGTSGAALMGTDRLVRADVEEGGRFYEQLVQLKALLDEDPVIWFRTCATAHGVKGKRFMASLAHTTHATIAAHTFIIGLWQAGLHTLRPKAAAEWSNEEGLGTDGKLAMSERRSPNCLTAMHAHIPRGW